MAGPPAYLKTAWPALRRPSASSRGDRDANQRCDRHCSPRSLPAPLSRALPLPQSDFTTPEKCKRVLDDLGEKYDPQATHQELKIQAAVANKRQRGQRLNFGETVTATEAARLQSVQSLLKIKDKVGQNFERNNPAVTIKCLIGEVRLPPPFASARTQELAPHWPSNCARGVRTKASASHLPVPRVPALARALFAAAHRA